MTAKLKAEDSHDGKSGAIAERRGANVLILSVAGKPIFVRYGSDAGPSPDSDGSAAPEDEWATACGLLQGLRANVLSFGRSGAARGAAALGDVQSIQAGKRLIVFKHTEALMLVSISDRKDGNHNEAWLRLQLEYVYSQVLFTLTDQVQAIFKKTPSYDIRNMLGPNEANSIRNLLDLFDPVDLDEGVGGSSRTRQDAASGHGTGCGAFLTAGVECIHPIPPEIREHTSKLLIHACRRANPRNLFAMLMVGTRLITLVQPSDPASHLHTSDLHLVLTFVGRQPGLRTDELWFPLCLPRFDPSGFLYAYTSCLDSTTGLTIALISPDNGTEQFENFRRAANIFRKNLGLRSVKKKVLRAFGSSSNALQASSTGAPTKGQPRRSDSDLSGVTADSVESERNSPHLDVSSWKMKDENEDGIYDDEEEDDQGKGIAQRIGAGHRPTLQGKTPSQVFVDESLGGETQAQHEAPLLTALQVALSAKQQEEMMNSYLKSASAVHFVFRCDIYVGQGDAPGGAGPAATGAMLTQCFGPPLSFPFVDASSQRHVWDVYQRLCLRLRLGSSSVEATMDALCAIAEGHQKNTQQNKSRFDHSHSRSVRRNCPMQCLLESPPHVHSVTYLQEDNELLFVGLNGKYFELYATLPATIPPKTGTAYCARLVRRLMGDERILFLSNPPTWGS